MRNVEHVENFITRIGLCLWRSVTVSSIIEDVIWSRSWIIHGFQQMLREQFQGHRHIYTLMRDVTPYLSRSHCYSEIFWEIIGNYLSRGIIEEWPCYAVLLISQGHRGCVALTSCIYKWYSWTFSNLVIMVIILTKTLYCTYNDRLWDNNNGGDYIENSYY